MAEPIILKPGEIRALYIHSTGPGDQAIVYDNTEVPFMRNMQEYSPPPRYEDALIAIYSGKAHVSRQPFGQTPIWGWGNSWRDHREFVGRLSFGARYTLWNPDTNYCFGPKFRQVTRMMLLLQRHVDSPVCLLPDECLYYILNMCHWNWFDDAPKALRAEKAKRKERKAIMLAEAAEKRACDASALASLKTSESAREEDCKPMAEVTVTDQQEDNDVNMEGMNEEAQLNDEESEDDNDELEELEVEIGHNEDEDNSDVGGDGGDGSDDDNSVWEHVHGYRADPLVFEYRYQSSDEDDETDAQSAGDDDISPQQQYFGLLGRLQFLRNRQNGVQVAAAGRPRRLNRWQRRHEQDNDGSEDGE